MSHEARDVLRVFYKLRDKVTPSVPDQQVLNMLQFTLFNLRFSTLDYPIQCVRCGKCCTSSGHITLSEEELADIKSYIKQSGKSKRLRFMKDQDIITLSGVPCPFYDKAAKSCTVYPVRPQVCRDFPHKHMLRKARLSHWSLVSFCSASDYLVMQQAMRNFEET